MAVISLDSSSVASCPSTKWLRLPHAEKIEFVALGPRVADGVNMFSDARSHEKLLRVFLKASLNPIYLRDFIRARPE
jgi:hypothetical protein